MAPQAIAAEAAEPHLEPERHCHVARCHQRRRRRREQRGHHDHHDPGGPHPAAHPLRPTLPPRRHLSTFPAPAVSGARTSRRTVPTNFRRSPAAEATSRRRACVAGEPRASVAGLGPRARPRDSSLRDGGTAWRAKRRGEVALRLRTTEAAERRGGEKRRRGEKRNGRGRVLMEQCFGIVYLFFWLQGM